MMDENVFEYLGKALSKKPLGKKIIDSVSKMYKKLEIDKTNLKPDENNLRQKYWKYTLIYIILNEILVERYVKPDNIVKDISLKELEFYDILEDNICFKDSMRFARVLNVMSNLRDDVKSETTVAEVQISNEFKNWLRNRITEYLNNLMIKISKLYDFKHELSDHFNNWLQLWKTVSSQNEQIIKLEEDVRKLDINIQGLSRTLRNTITRCTELLQDVLKVRGPQSVLEMINIQATWANNFLNAINLKLNICQVNIQKDLYIDAKLNILQYLSYLLKMQKQHLNNKLLELKRSHEAYLSAGSEFEHLANQYNDLCVTLENRTWALNECRSTT